MPALFEAYITNLGKYNEGELVGETLKFPTTKEEVQGLLKRIGVDGVRYSEICGCFDQQHKGRGQRGRSILAKGGNAFILRPDRLYHF